jgi:hypothetical protein
MNARTLLILISLLLVLTAQVGAQDNNDSATVIQDLRWQLNEVQNKEADIKIRLQELEQELKPESIERYFSGYGSTRPEELREMRRKQLQSEKDRLLAQSEQLAASRVRLESAVASAEALAYQKSAQGVAVLGLDQVGGSSFSSASLKLGVILLLIMLGGVVVAMAVLRKRTLKP